jgi:hypothetical protein
VPRRNSNAAIEDAPSKGRTAAVLSVGAVVLAASGFLYFRMAAGEPRAVLPAAADAPRVDGYYMLCNGCRASFSLKQSDFETWPKNEFGAYKCPKCPSFDTEADNSKVPPPVETRSGG